MKGRFVFPIIVVFNKGGRAMAVEIISCKDEILYLEDCLIPFWLERGLMKSMADILLSLMKTAILMVRV